MFKIISIASFLITLAAIGLHCLIFHPKFDELFGPKRLCRWLDIFRIPVLIITVCLPEQSSSLWGVVKKLLYLFVMFCVLVLVVTGFWQPLLYGKSLSGYLIMIHSTFAPIFIVCFAILALGWSKQNSFNRYDCPWLMRFLQRVVKLGIYVEKTEKEGFLPVRKISFWVLMFLALVVAMSMVSSMFRIFGTDMQHFLMNLHRYSALTFVIVAMVHTYTTALAKARQEI